MPSTSVPIAIIGSGIFVKEQHLPAVLATPRLALKIIYSRTHASAQSTAALLPASHPPVDLYAEDAPDNQDKNYAAVLARPDIAAVLIALPIAAQPAAIEAALRAGKHVLSEKPVGPDVAGARRLIEWYRDGGELGSGSGAGGLVWSVAEQFRFLPKYVWAAEQARALGTVLGFNFRVFQLCGEDNKYLQTPWRKKPTHPYGFVLDGGVHHTAAARMFLAAAGDKAATVTGFSSLAQAYIAPVDTLSAVVKTASGAVGSFSCSWGTTLPRTTEYQIACERGSVTVSGDRGWVVYKDGRRDEAEFPFTQGAGVMQEVEAWAAALAEGREEALLSPEATLGDLELLEGMLKSADADGAAVHLKYQ